MSELDNILNSGESRKKLPEEKLMAYLEGRLSAAEQHEVEQWLADEGMEGDALEGLRNVGSHETKETVSRLNHKLRKQLAGKKHKRRQPIISNRWAIIAVAIILLLGVLAYFVISMMVKR